MGPRLGVMRITEASCTLDVNKYWQAEATIGPCPCVSRACNVKNIPVVVAGPERLTGSRCVHGTDNKKDFFIFFCHCLGVGARD